MSKGKNYFITIMEENNCIIIKYRAEIENYEEKRCFVLDEFYSKRVQ